MNVRITPLRVLSYPARPVNRGNFAANRVTPVEQLLNNLRVDNSRGLRAGAPRDFHTPDFTLLCHIAIGTSGQLLEAT